MFLKEIFSILTFSFVTLVFSGFAIKVDKFEYTALTSKPEEQNKNLYWLDMPEESFKKLELETKRVFHYFEDGKEKFSKIDYFYFSPIHEEKLPKIKYIRVILDIDDHHSTINNHSVLRDSPSIFSPAQSSNTRKSQKETTKVIKYFVESKFFWVNLFC